MDPDRSDHCAAAIAACTANLACLKGAITSPGDLGPVAGPLTAVPNPAAPPVTVSADPAPVPVSADPGDPAAPPVATVFADPAVHEVAVAASLQSLRVTREHWDLGCQLLFQTNKALVDKLIERTPGNSMHRHHNYAADRGSLMLVQIWISGRFATYLSNVTPTCERFGKGTGNSGKSRRWHAAVTLHAWQAAMASHAWKAAWSNSPGTRICGTRPTPCSPNATRR